MLLLKKENEILKLHLTVQNKKLMFSRKDRFPFAFIKYLSERALKLTTTRNSLKMAKAIHQKYLDV
jgi:hypothetical protein